jgi:hypothetical protein
MAKNVVTQNQVNKAIKGEIYNALRTALVAPVSPKSKKTWTENFIQEMLEQAKKNPNGPLGQLVAKQIMTDDILTKLDEQTDKGLARDYDFLEYRLLKQLYAEQRELFLDDKISKKILIGSRRIGKTTLATRLMVKDCIRPGRHALFIGLKLDSGPVNLTYNECIRLADSIGLEISSKNEASKTIEFVNGSRITCKGNYTVRDQDTNFQGDHYSLVILDECQSQKNVQHLLDDLIIPAMSDYKEDAKIVLTGTPPRIKGTYAEKIWKEFKGWKHYSWNMSKNPYIVTETFTLESIIENICKEKGIKEDAPFIRREYFGEWFYDTEAQVFKDFHVHRDVPDGFIPTDIAIGTDYGFSDYNSIIALAYNRINKKAYVIAERKFNKSTVSEIVGACRDVFESCKQFALNRNKDFDFSKICFYCDTNEQSITYELATNYGLPVYNCYKHDKKMAIAQLADWCRSGRISVPNDGVLCTEFEKIVYKRDENDNILAEIDDELFHPDAMDALLYASRQYAYDCGESSGGESSDKVKKEESRNSTLPDWIKFKNGDENE